MNWRMNLLALAVYAALGIVAGTAVFFTMRQWSRDTIQASNQQPLTSSGDDEQSTAAHLDQPLERSTTDGRPRGDSSDVALLRTLLDERLQQISSLRQKINAAKQQREDLQERYDRMLAMMEDWLQLVDTMDSSTPNENAPPQQSLPPEEAPAGKRSLAEVERRMADLQEELTTMALELAERETQIDDLTDQLIERESTIPLIASRLLRPVADQIVPRLNTMLGDNNVLVRKTACELILTIGPAAQGTEDALRTLADSETNAEVKKLAAAALEAIAD